MYSDGVEAETETGSKKTVKNRLSGGLSTHGTWKRERQDDDKWEHDLFDDDKPRISNRRVDSRDLRLKLQKKHHGLQSGRGASLGMRDLREKLSWMMDSQPRSGNPQKSKREATRPAIKNVAVDSFVESLGLEKYSTAFQVEEVDMDARMHMADDDLKAMLIPMGPRKKILLALGSKRG
ncbi:unnamed protein product [Arabis nemorensis]|uniref:SAM domain-containing protein n=1 Tax=Arabis nemorensis TaxID=586526 RepID=A0A565CP81_9BRAS|nr:unnamed protein product [Arabis nemorensis]